MARREGQKLYFENLGGMLIRRDGMLSWRCPDCKSEGNTKRVRKTCPKCRNRKGQGETNG